MGQDLVAEFRRGIVEFLGETDAPPPLISYAAFDNGSFLEVGSVKDGEQWHAPDDKPRRFRVASLTKSFTAAALLRLRDLGKLFLEDPASSYVSEIQGWSMQPTLRELLTMTGGLVTDNPWADRLQEMPLDAFRAFLAAGEPAIKIPTGTFEYSNLGYAILGLVVSETAETEYARLIDDWFLAPLEMSESTFSLDDTDPQLVTGYGRKGDRWQPEPSVSHGALSPMGGLVSSARDIARWALFLSAGFRGDDPETDNILSAVSRRQMQTVQAVSRSPGEQNVAAPASTVASGYGFGLRVTTQAALGTFAGHPGGYPGYGAHMWWHPHSGAGVVALANATYCPVWDVTQPTMENFVRQHMTGNESVPVTPWLMEAMLAIDRLIDEWSDEAVLQLFSHNVDADRPLSALQDELKSMRERHGPFGPAYCVKSDTPGEVAWRRPGESATIAVSALLDPTQQPRVQQLEVELILSLAPSRRKLLDRLIQLMDGTSAVWPDDVDVAENFEDARSLTVASLLYGPVSLDHLISNREREMVAQLTTKTGESIRMAVTYDGEERLERLRVLRSGLVPVEVSEALD